MSYAPHIPPSEKFVSFTNPTNDVVVVDVWEGPAAGRSGKYRYTWQPGETVMVPEKYVPAIHDVRDGVIVGGGAPQLKRVGGTDSLHPCLDVAAVAKSQQVKAIMDAKQVSDLLNQLATNGAQAVLAAQPQPAQKQNSK